MPDNIPDAAAPQTGMPIGGKPAWIPPHLAKPAPRPDVQGAAEAPPTPAPKPPPTPKPPIWQPPHIVAEKDKNPIFQKPDMGLGKAPPPAPSAKPIVFPAPQEPRPSLIERARQNLKAGFSAGIGDIFSTAYKTRELVNKALEESHIVSKEYYEKEHAALEERAAHLRKTLEESAPHLPAPEGFRERAVDIAAGVFGGLPGGAAEYMMGIPFAALHGIKTAEEKAREKGRSPTTWEITSDAFIEMAGRSILGVLNKYPMGSAATWPGIIAKQSLRGAAFAGTSGVETILLDKEATKEAAINAGVNGLIGLLTPGANFQSQRVLNKAEALVREGKIDDALHLLRNQDLFKGTPSLKEVFPEMKAGGRLSAAERQKVFEASILPGDPSKIEKAFQAKPGSPEARAIADASFRRAIAEGEWTEAHNMAKLQSYADQYVKYNDTYRAFLIKQYATKGLDGLAGKDRQAFQYFAKLFDDIERSEKHAGIPMDPLQNYFPAFWKIRPSGEPVQATARSGMHKFFSDIYEGIGAGGVPVTTNPAVLALLRMRSSISKVRQQDGIALLREAGLAHSIKEEGIFERMAPGRDRFEWEKRTVNGKEWIIEPEANRKFQRAFLDFSDENAITNLLRSEGIHVPAAVESAEKSVFKTWFALKNLSIPIKLSFSAFHPLHMLGIERASAISVLAKTPLKDLPAEMTRVFRQKDPILPMLEGRKAMLTFGRAGGEMERFNEALMLLGGFNPRHVTVNERNVKVLLSEVFRHDVPWAIKGFLNHPSLYSFKEMLSVPAKGFLELLYKSADAMSGPMFQTWIPAMKSWAYLNLANRTVLNHPEYLSGTPEANHALSIALSKVARDVDARFGMMQYSKEFWHPVIKQAAFSYMLSTGWHIGFMRQFAGGLIRDPLAAAKSAARKMKGAPLRLTEKAQQEITGRWAYAAAYVALYGVIHSVLSYLSTGVPPSEDPRTFLYIRVPPEPGEDPSKPRFEKTQSFMNDFGAIYFNAVRKALGEAKEGHPLGVVGAAGKGTAHMLEGWAAPPLSPLFEALSNHKFNGGMIYDPDAPMEEKLVAGLGHIFSHSFAPISMQDVLEDAAPRGKTAGQIAAKFGGFNPAAEYVSRKPYQEFVQEWKQSHPSPFDTSERLKSNEYAELLRLAGQVKRGEEGADDRLLEKANELATRHPDVDIKRLVSRMMKPEYYSEVQRMSARNQKKFLELVPFEDRKQYTNAVKRFMKEDPEGFKTLMGIE